MGYRSDVAFGVGFRSRDRLLSFLTSLKLQGEFSAAFMADLCIIEDGEVWLLHGEYEDVKWYEGFAKVDSTGKLLYRAGEMGLPTAFIRVGEDTDDVVEDIGNADNRERDINMWDYYRVVRSVDKPSFDGATPVMEMLGSDRGT